jgi:hypothetical protein
MKTLYKHTQRKKKTQFKNTLINQLETAYQSNPKHYWKLLGDLKQIENSKNDNLPNPGKFIEHFKMLFKPHTPKASDVNIINQLRNAEQTQTFNALDFRISINEVTKSISQSKNGKSSGIDSIRGEMLKVASEQLAPIMTKLFNKILCEGIYPTTWSVGITIPIFKKGNKNDPNNYRGITISSNVAKVFNSILNNRLNKYALENDLINERQIGFKKDARTSDHIFIIKTLIDKYCRTNKSPIYACFIDFQKAFDSIWHDALMLKLQQNGIGGLFYSIIKNMYAKANTFLKSTLGLSEKVDIKRGVKQGDVLSPTLFNIFINDLIPLLNSTGCCPPKLVNKDVGCLLYADDLVILSTTPKGLQMSLDKLNNYCTNWKLSINWSKSKIMTFSYQGNKAIDKFKIGDKTLESVDSYSYLGMELSSTGSFTQASKTLTNKAMKAMFKLKKIIANTNLTPVIQLKLFGQLITPICLYSAEIWAVDMLSKNHTANDYKLEASYDKLSAEKLNLSFSKFCLGVHKRAQNSAVRGELGKLPLAIEAITKSLKYYGRLQTLDNDTLLGEALITNTKCANRGSNDVRKWQNICKTLNVDVTKMKSETFVKNTIGPRLAARYTDFWQNKIRNEDKMRTYVKIKSNFLIEDYLSIPDFRTRRSLAKLRISAHRLEIERGRYSRPKTPACDRLCKVCNINEIEDEFHFVMKCSRYNTEREEFMRYINSHVKNFRILNEQNKFIYLLSAGGDIALKTAKYVASCFTKRDGS